MSDPLRLRRDRAAIGWWELASAVPTRALDGAVLGYTGVLGELAVAAERHLPSGETAILVNLGEAYGIVTPDGERVCVAANEAFVMGVHTRPFRTLDAGRKHLALVRLAPWATARLLRRPMTELTDRWARLDQFDPDLARGLVAAARTPDWRSRFDAFDRQLAKALGGAPAGQTTARAWSALRQSGGRTRIASLARAAEVSHRHLIARFRAETGVGPKTAARIERFNRVLSVMGRTRRAANAETAVAAGYADQAHMIGEFRHFARMTPSSVMAKLVAFTLGD